jgi:hypothetical protein
MGFKKKMFKASNNMVTAPVRSVRGRVGDDIKHCQDDETVVI